MPIDNTDDVIDSRDVIARIELLEGLDPDGDDATELRALRKLAAECEGIEDWEHGVALVRDSYFVAYAKEMAEDIGDIPRQGHAQWPFYCIDWEYAARELQIDYTPVTFDGVTYWVRP